MYSGGFELTKLTYYTRVEDNLIRHRGDRFQPWDDSAPRLGKELCTLPKTDLEKNESENRLSTPRIRYKTKSIAKEAGVPQ